MVSSRTCDLGRHETTRKTEMRWCCPECLLAFTRNLDEIKRQGELDREAAIRQRDENLYAGARRDPYRFVPYTVLALAFIAFLIVSFL